MSVENRSGVDVIISLGGSDKEGELLRARMLSKSSHRRVEVCVLGIDDQNRLKDPTGHVERALMQVDCFSRITIIGHSSTRGSTLQFDAPEGMTIPISQRIRHFSEITDFIAERIDRSLFDSPEHPLAISLRSCQGASGGEQSLAAKMQRHLAVAHNVYCNMTARKDLIFVADPGYTMNSLEYGLRYFNLKATEVVKKVPKEQRKGCYVGTREVQESHHKRKGSKVQLEWSAAGEQYMHDAYAYSIRFTDKAKQLCGACKEALLSIQPTPASTDILFRASKQITTLEFALQNVSRADPKLINKTILPALKKLEKSMVALGLDCSAVRELIAYAKKYVSTSFREERIGGPITLSERQNYKSPTAIVADKRARMESLLFKIPTSCEQREALLDVFCDPAKGVLAVISKHYAYQLKYELGTSHVDALIAKLELLLEKIVAEPSLAESMLDASSSEMQEIMALVQKTSEGATSEGIQRARKRGINGLPKIGEFIRASRKQRDSLLTGLRSQLRVHLPTSDHESATLLPGYP